MNLDCWEQNCARFATLLKGGAGSVRLSDFHIKHKTNRRKQQLNDLDVKKYFSFPM